MVQLASLIPFNWMRTVDIQQRWLIYIFKAPALENIKGSEVFVTYTPHSCRPFQTASKNETEDYTGEYLLLIFPIHLLLMTEGQIVSIYRKKKNLIHYFNLTVSLSEQ